MADYLPDWAYSTPCKPFCPFQASIPVIAEYYQLLEPVASVHVSCDVIARPCFQQRAILYRFSKVMTVLIAKWAT
jgi:hypothetical protein